MGFKAQLIDPTTDLSLIQQVKHKIMAQRGNPQQPSDNHTSPHNGHEGECTCLSYPFSPK